MVDVLMCLVSGWGLFLSAAITFLSNGIFLKIEVERMGVC